MRESPKPLPSLSIFFPAFNDAEALPALLRTANRVANKLSNDYEIIVVNDGSTDTTPAVLSRLTQTLPRLRVITHQKNQGYGAAIRTGIKSSKKEWVFYTDGDGQYDPEDLVEMVKRLKPNIDVVNGYKIKRRDRTHRKIIGMLYNRFIQFWYRPPIRDVDCDFRLMRGSLVRKITLTTLSATVCLELVMKLKARGARFAEMPVYHYKRQYGSSQFFSVKNMLRTGRELFTLYF